MTTSEFQLFLKLNRGQSQVEKVKENERRNQQKRIR